MVASSYYYEIGCKECYTENFLVMACRLHVVCMADVGLADANEAETEKIHL